MTELFSMLLNPASSALAALDFPQFDPIAVEIGPLAIRWYALAYIAGLTLAWRYCRWLAKRQPSPITPEMIDDFLTWATLGVILGGRLGYVFFYKPGYYLSNPLEIFMLWQGGMAFHGGFLGVVLAGILFARKYKFSFLWLTDLAACAAPIGLFLGRIANFINGELYGRVTTQPWGMIFPNSDGLPRHPSQLYQAGMEGLALVVIFFFLVRWGRLEQAGFLSGAFLVGYGLARVIGELFRQPDAHLGILFGFVTMGQMLSIPMILGGGYLIWRAQRLAAQAQRPSR